jgi:hypothetical protein
MLEHSSSSAGRPVATLEATGEGQVFTPWQSTALPSPPPVRVLDPEQSVMVPEARQVCDATVIVELSRTDPHR